MKKISLLVFFVFFFFTIKVMAKADLRIELDELGTQSWVSEKISQFPELLWLMDKNVRKTQEGIESEKTSWSKQLTGIHYTEFERTILSLVTLHLLMEGSEKAYNKFILPQNKETRLSYLSFKKLHAFTNSVIENDLRKFKLLETNLILGDIGKTKFARDLAKRKCGITEPDHDVFLDICLTSCPNIFPSFEKLASYEKEIIKKITGKIHLGHVTHLEDGPIMFKKLKESGILNNKLKIFNIEILTHICDVAAASGHINNQGSTEYHKHTYQVKQALFSSIDSLASKSEKEALGDYLLLRAKLLGFNKHSDVNFVLTRIGCMLRLFEQQDGEKLKKGWGNLSKEDKMLLLKEMDPFKNFPGVTPTYIPALLINLMNQYGEQGIEMAVTKGVLLIAKILQQYKAGKANIKFDPDLTINFNQVAKQIKENPKIVNCEKFNIDHEGMVSITCFAPKII